MYSTVVQGTISAHFSGYLPEMALHSTQPSTLNDQGDDNAEKSSHPGTQELSSEDLQWDSQITQEEAEQILEQEFYPFKKVDCECV